MSLARNENKTEKMMLMTRWLMAGLAAVSVVATANTVVIGTRVIYPSNSDQISIQLQNTGNHASLIQTWIDEGDVNASPKDSKAPFFITPPTTRIDANETQTLRLKFTGSKQLPNDRESLFYFNMLDVPPKPKAEDIGESQNYLQFAVRNRLKLFYRPSGLSMRPQDAYQQVVWRHHSHQQIEIENPTPYHITFSRVRIGNQVSDSLEMLSPFSKLIVEVPNSQKGDKVQWQVVTDHGGIGDGESLLQ